MSQPQIPQWTSHPAPNSNSSTSTNAPPKDPSFLAWEKEKADALAREAAEWKVEQEDKARRRAQERLQNSIYEQVDFVNNIKAKVSPPPNPVDIAAGEYEKREVERKDREKRHKDEEALAKYRREAEERKRKEEWQEQFGTLSKGWESQIGGLKKTLEERERREEAAAAKSAARLEGVKEGEERGRRERSGRRSRGRSGSQSRSRSRNRERGSRQGGAIEYGYGNDINANLLLETALRAANAPRAINHPVYQGVLSNQHAYGDNQGFQLGVSSVEIDPLLTTSRFNNTSRHLSSKLDALENRQRNMTSRFGGMENRFGGLETKVDGLERAVLHRFDRLDDSMKNLSLSRGGEARGCESRGYGSAGGLRDIPPGWYRVD